MSIKIGIWVFLILGFFAILSFNLLGQPLYLDEGLYIFWASLFHSDPNFAYVSMQDGKTPLFIWLTSFLNPFFQNYLFTGRLISVLASLITMICGVLLAWKIAGSKAAFFAFILFLICPFNILISRMAFVDSLFIAFGNLSITCLFFARDFIQNKKIILGFLLAVFAGIFLGLGFMTKTTARVFLVAEIIVIGFWILVEFKNGYRDFINLKIHSLRSHNFRTIFLLIIFAALLIGLYFEILGYLRIGGLRHWGMISIKEADLTFSLREIFANLTGHTSGYYYLKNLPLYMEYLVVYFGTILVFFVFGIWQLFKKRENLWLLIIPVIFFFAVFLSAKIPASRYLAILIPQVLIISAIGLNKIWPSKVKFSKLFIIILLAIPAIMSSILVASPTKAIYASDDRSYFVESEINVYGLDEIINILEAQKDTSVLGIDASWGINEGLTATLGEKGIKTVVLNKFIPTLPSEDLECEEGYAEQGLCWKLNIGRLKDFPDKQAFIYMTLNPNQVDLLSRISNVEIIKEFKRANSGVTSYLIKFNGYKKQ